MWLDADIFLSVPSKTLFPFQQCCITMTNGEHRGIRSTRINIVSVAGKVYLCPDSNYQVHQANIWNKSIA